ncbi:MAG: hypothetical protein WDN45_02750 [Caulobacteraceae bacterium]
MAFFSWSPQSQRMEPNRSPVRQAEWARTSTGLEGSGSPTTTATWSRGAGPPRKTMKRPVTPLAMGTSAWDTISRA